MGLCFALNHGVVTTPLGVATSTLGVDVANIGNAVLYSFTLLSSLLLGAPFVGTFGAKNGLLFAMLLYCVYVACFGAAALFDQGTAGQWAAFLAGSTCGGLAAGVLWTAQGGYFGSTATQLAAATGQSREETTARLAGQFASVYLALEVASKLGFSGLRLLDVDVWQAGALYFALGALALLLMTRVYDLESPRAADEPVAEPTSKLTAAISLWSDPVVWLLAPTNLAFGFCAAYMNGYVNGTYAAQELGSSSVAFLGAVTALVAAVLAKVYGPLGERLGKGPVIALGAACFFCIPLCSLALGCCADWGWWLIVLYLLQGSGRAVYESTNRAVFSDFFPGPKTESAFANCMLQSSLAFAVCFFLQTSLTGPELERIVLVLSVLAPLGYVLARDLRAKREALEDVPGNDQSAFE